MINPYESPVATNQKISTPGLAVLRGVFFCLNSLVAALFITAGLSAPFQDEWTLGTIFSVLFVGPILAYEIGECLAYFGGSKSAERVIGGFNLGGAVVTAFGIVANLVELLFKEPSRLAEDWPFILVFVSVGSAIVIYFAICGYLRVKWSSPS